MVPRELPYPEGTCLVPLSARTTRAPQWMRRHCVGQLLLRGMPGGVDVGADRSGEQDPDTGPFPAPRPQPKREPKPLPRRRDQAPNRPPRGPGGPDRPPTKPRGGVAARRAAQAPKSKRRMQRGIAHYQFLDGDKVRITTTRGHAIVASTPWELWHGLRECHTEAEIAAYARWKGETPEWETVTELDDPTELPAMRPTVTVEQLAERERLKHAVSYSMHSVSRPDTASPTSWTPNPPDDQGESWTSPNGRVWRSRRVIDRIKRKRAALGLATSYEELHGDEQRAASG